MTPMKGKHAVVLVIATVLLGMASTARAQTPPADNPWSVEVAMGWDNGITGSINASGVGTINNQVTVITKNSYNDVYGAGLHLKFGGGYMFNEQTEARVTFTFQSLDADFVVPMGDIGISNLYGQYTDYQSTSLDVGLRQYARLSPTVRAYGEGTIGIGFIDETDVALVAPGANLAATATDFYDQTAAFAMGFNVGVLVQTGERLGLFGQMGLRYMSGMSQIDGFIGTGLDNVNDKSARWTLPVIFGARYSF